MGVIDSKYFCDHCKSEFSFENNAENPRCPSCLKKTSVKPAEGENEREILNLQFLQRRQRAQNACVLLVVLAFVATAIGPQEKTYVIKTFGSLLAVLAMMGIILWVTEAKHRRI